MNSKKNTSIKKGEPIFPCKLCPKNVADNDNAILCDLCQTWVHIKSNHLSYMDYKYLRLNIYIKIYKVVINHGISSLVRIHFFHLVIWTIRNFQT